MRVVGNGAGQKAILGCEGDAAAEDNDVNDKPTYNAAGLGAEYTIDWRR